MFGISGRRWCLNCGARVHRGAVLCPACGAALIGQKESGQCPNCGARLADTDEVCPICGARRPARRHPLRAIGAWALVLGFLVVIVMAYVAWSRQPSEEPVVVRASTATLAPTLTSRPSRTMTHTATLTCVPSASPSATVTRTSIPAATAAPARYTVVRGDSLSAITVRFALDLQSLREANGLAEDAVLQVGQELVIPSQKGGPIFTPAPSSTSTPDALVHIVKAGDSLSAISVKYDIDMETIAAANGIEVDSTLKIGQEIIIPGVKPTLTPTPSPSPTATQMPTPSPRPIASITPAFPYRQPHLLAPIDGEVVEGAEPSIVLNWTSVGILGERQWYSLLLWVPGEEAPLRFWTKVPSWRMDPELYPDAQHGCEFAWQVAVIFRSSEESDGVAISLPSEKRSFSWR